MSGISYDTMISYIIENQEKFYRLAYSYVRNKDQALDIVQNSIVKALENYSKLRNPNAIKTWVYRVIVNESITMLRKEKRETVYEPEQIDEMREEAVPENEPGIFEQVNCLPFELRTVIILRFYEDLPLKEIAKVTNTNLSTTKYRLYSAISKLKTVIKEEAL